MSLNDLMKFFAVAIAISVWGCNGNESDKKDASSEKPHYKDTMMIANLYTNGPGTNAIRDAFVARNPGYDLAFLRQTNDVKASSEQRVAFLQTGGGTAILGDEKSKISVGDIIMIPPNTGMTIDSLVDLLVFTSPDKPSDSIPNFIRPDWDPNITDVPGGCATETNAYRRILLTWLGKVGKYLYKSINAHRVRITDSFTHYHPKDGGFDEFYLVQMVLPDATIITSHKLDLVENHDKLDKESATDLLDQTKLKVGDLVYLPRTVIHRGIGGVLAQVITVPGFVPKAEIGVDHHLKKINEKFDVALPYNALASDEPMIK